jgi:hypothetical protein
MVESVSRLRWGSMHHAWGRRACKVSVLKKGTNFLQDLGVDAGD